jgi:O-antigen ligase
LPRRFFPILVSLAAIAVVTWFATPVHNTLTARAEAVSTGTDASADLRNELNRGSVEIWKTSPFVGVGLGNSRRHLSDFVSLPFLPGADYSFNSANAYIGLLGEGGPLAVFALVAALVALWRRNPTAPHRLESLTRLFIVLFALQFLVINGLALPPLWFWGGLRLSLKKDGP